MIHRGAYAAHEILVGPARARPELWRTSAGLIMIATTAIMLGTLLSFLTWFILQPGPNLLGEPSALSTLFMLGGFICITLGVAVALRLLHNRGLSTALGPRRAVLRDFAATFRALAVLIIAVALLPPYDMGAPLTPNLAPGLWLALLPLSLGALLIQTSAEEILFRGYLQQQLAARFSSPFVWMAVPSALFALGHYIPAEAGQNAVYVSLWAGLFGFFAADLTARAGNVGPAIALHFTNNLTAVLLVSLPGGLSGLSLYTIDVDISDPATLTTWFPIDLAMMVLMWLAARLAIRR